MIYALADLHLDYTEEKSMEVFGSAWENYQEKIFKNWRDTIKQSDTVLIPGDISWAMDLEDAKVDLKKIEDLPGRKILMKGNHDYWWSSLNKLKKLGFKSIDFLQNNAFEVEDYIICGTRGWISRDSRDFDYHDEKIFKRELLRLENSIGSIQKKKKLIVNFHYPPINSDGTLNEFFELAKKYPTDTIVYGHLHGKGHRLIKEGKYDLINLVCASADYLDFKPVRIK